MSGKICSSCGEWKPHDKFQVRKASKDRLTAACKGCLKIRDQIRDKDPARIAMRDRYAKGHGKEKADAAKQRYVERNPKKRAAHIAVGNALRDGHLAKQPCEQCGSLDVHAHHDDYNEPLKVRFLCPKHHQAWHDMHGEGLNPD